MRKDIFKQLENDTNLSSLDEATKQRFLGNIFKLKGQKVNLMVTGATGSGKSSTINALFDMNIAKVGVGVDPETMDIQKYELGNLILWDSPGLGDGKEKDIQHSKAIINKLNETDDNGNLLIDLILVVLDGSTRDLGTSYELINSVIIPNLGKNAKDRIFVAINQADAAMKGRHWDYEENKPHEKLEEFLEDKKESVRKRIKDGTGINIEPIYYSAGFKEDGEHQKPYNLSKLLYFIVQNTPIKKRLAYINNISEDKEMWSDNDELKDYNKEIKESFMQTISECALKGADIGGDIGSIFGSTGRKIGTVLGGITGAAVGFISSLF